MAPSSVRVRRSQLAQFGRQHPDPRTVTRVDVGAWMLTYSAETRKGWRSALHSYYAWAAVEGLSEIDPTLGIKVRVAEVEARPCPEDEWRQAEQRLAASPRPRDRATALMIGLGARCGMRRSEIACCHVRDIEGQRLRIHGKGSKQRTVPVPALLLGQLREQTGYCFPGAYGGAMTGDAAGRRIAAALPHGWTAHTLRHRYATKAYEETGDLLLVQQLLGHASPTTTMRYIRLGSKDALIAEVMGR